MPKLSKVEEASYKGFAPPTLFYINEFTMPFQLITETYAVPKYKEVNPSFFGCVTFPFLFGVMFGDVAHGLLIFAFGCALCLHGKTDGLLARVIEMRYLVLLMGFFSVYCGFIYNDFASIPIWLSSCYVYPPSLNGDPVQLPGCVHVLGLDPAWYVSS